ncbi:MAG: hypothetical protein KC421_05855 [Anaerolineales bacterium]|nr:hypothetical protein [Anaerolineales bacterium]
MTFQQTASFKRLLTILAFLAALALVGPSTVIAQSDAGITLDAGIGFDGYFKAEYWVPVYVNVANSGPALEGELRVTVGTTSFGDKIVYSSPISLPTQSDKRVVIYVNKPQFYASTLELVTENGRIAATVTLDGLQQIARDGILYGIVSPEPGEFEFLDRVTAGGSDVGVAFLQITDLPETAAAWNALDVLVFNDVDTGTLTSAQRDALVAWVETGGQLVITGGPGWQKTTAALADLLPVAITGSDSVADLPALSQDIGQPFRDPGPYLVTTSSLRGGELLYYQDNLPLLAAQARGRGTVYFMALDPKLAPLLDWNGSEILWSRIATNVPKQPPWGVPVQNSYAAGTAVTSLPSLSLPSAWQLILFLFIYTILIGPVNYIILKRRNQLEKAWLTIPVMILIFSGVAYTTGFQLRGNDVLINQMSVAFSHADGDQARVQSLLGLYSPRRSNYDLVLPGDSVIRPFAPGFGSISGSGHIDAISLSNELTVQNVRVDISDVETFLAQSVQPAIAVTGHASLENDGSQLLLSATIQNNSDQRLDTASLLLGDRAIAVGDIPPGDIVTVSEVVGSFSGTATFAPGPAVPGFAAGNANYVLSSNADVLLGSTNYYDDADLFTRWQLLQALEDNSGSSSTTSLPTKSVTLIAWSDTLQLDARLANNTFETSGTTLYFVEIPLTQNLISGDTVTVPESLMNWKVLANNNVYTAGIQEFSLNGGWIEYEFMPWPDFQRMTVTDLTIVLEGQTADTAPEVRLWHWQEEIWDTVNAADWGETAVSDYTPYIGTNNTIRLHLQDQSQYGAYINLVYPRLTGDLK